MTYPLSLVRKDTPRMLSSGTMPTVYLHDADGQVWHKEWLCGVSYSYEGALLDLHNDCRERLTGDELDEAMKAIEPHMTPEILHRWDSEETP